MRKLLFIWLVGVLVFLFESGSEPRQVKYVFYFIGDGMGVNQVNGTEMFLAELDSVIGVKGLNFASFPVRNYATTYSSYNGVTCSAAAGTAAQAVRPCPFLLHKKRAVSAPPPFPSRGPVGGHSGPPLQTVLGQGGIYARLNIFITGILREHNL